MGVCIGLDFGTTNSALALARREGEAALATFGHAGGTTATFRSILYFEGSGRGTEGRPAVLAGPRAIDRYLESGGDGRLLQSLKSFLASALFKSTNVFGTVYSLEELIAVLLRAIRVEAEAQFGPLGGRVVLGRPVRFVNTEGDAAEDFPLKRLRAAAALAGFDDVVFEYEPVAAAYFYESRLDHDELVLIADFGGGTSDFCLMRVGPGVRRRGRTAKDMLGTDGVGLAGDAFDSQVVRHALTPHLGAGSFYRSYFDKKRIPVPPWIYEKFRRWHHLSFLKSRETMHFLREVRAMAEKPEQIDALIYAVDEDLGYHLYRAVEGTKTTLSSEREAVFRFRDGPLEIAQPVQRGEFEQWIDEETRSIGTCVDRLLNTAGLRTTDVDRVFMTGGTSLVPAVRNLFATRFGEAKLSAGDELTSVALGLALRARDGA